MPSIINATVTSGLTANSDTSGNLIFQTSSTNVLTLDSSQNATFAGNVSSQNATFAGSVSSINTFGFKNRIINGDMRIDQRNAGAVYTTTAGAGIYMVDRWAISPQGGGGTAQRVSGSSLGTKYALQLNGAAGITQFQAFSRLEAVNVYDLVGQTVTYSFRGISSTAGLSVNWYINYPSAVDDYTSQNTITSGTWSVGTTAANYSATFTIPSGYTNGLTVYIAPNNFTSGTFQFSNVQLEKGSVATPFDYRDYASELVRCQRYYQKSYDIETAAGTATRTGFINWNWGSMTSYATAYIVLPVRMRASPTVTNYNPDLTNTVGGRYWNGSAEVAFTGSLSGITAYSSGFIFSMDATSRSNMLFQWTAISEF